jgi:hypothetical protein
MITTILLLPPGHISFSNDGRCANLIVGDNVPMTDGSIKNITSELHKTVSDQYPRHSKSKVDGRVSNPRQILHKVDEHYVSMNSHLVSVYFCVLTIHTLSQRRCKVF